MQCLAYGVCVSGVGLYLYQLSTEMKVASGCQFPGLEWDNAYQIHKPFCMEQLSIYVLIWEYHDYGTILCLVPTYTSSNYNHLLDCSRYESCLNCGTSTVCMSSDLETANNSLLH